MSEQPPFEDTFPGQVYRAERAESALAAAEARAERIERERQTLRRVIDRSQDCRALEAAEQALREIAEECEKRARPGSDIAIRDAYRQVADLIRSSLPDPGPVSEEAGDE